MRLEIKARRLKCSKGSGSGTGLNSNSESESKEANFDASIMHLTPMMKTRKQYSKSNTTNKFNWAISSTIFILFLLILSSQIPESSGCLAKNAKSAENQSKVKDTATSSKAKIQQEDQPVPVIEAPKVIGIGTEKDLNSNKPVNSSRSSENENENAPNLNSNSTNPDRAKRQLFREDIPQHRPLSGNIHAHYHGFPLPGRFNENGGQKNPVQIHNIHNNQIDLPGYGEPEHPHVIHTHTVSDGVTIVNHGHSQEDHGPAHEQEIIHRYPVEVSQVIQLDHGHGHGHGLSNPGSNIYHVAPPSNEPHAPPKVHPNQDPVRHPHEHQTKPYQPPDLVVKEPNGESQEGIYEGEIIGHGHGHGGGHGLYGSQEYGLGGGGGEYAQGFGYTQTHPDPEPPLSPGPAPPVGKIPLIYQMPYRGAYKFAQFLKRWPQILLSKMYGNRHYGGGAGAAAVIGVHHAHVQSHEPPTPTFPIWPFFRRFRTKVKHNHYHHF